MQKNWPSNIFESSSCQWQASSVHESNSDQYQIPESEAYTISQDGTIAIYFINQLNDNNKKLKKIWEK